MTARAHGHGCKPKRPLAANAWRDEGYECGSVHVKPVARAPSNAGAAVVRLVCASAAFSRADCTDKLADIADEGAALRANWAGMM